MARVRKNKKLKHQIYLKTWMTGGKGRRYRCYRLAYPWVIKRMTWATHGRHMRRRITRHIWFGRIGAASAEHDIAYSRLINSLHKDNIWLNRKMLADFALNEPYSFRSICEHVLFFFCFCLSFFLSLRFILCLYFVRVCLFAFIFWFCEIA